MSCRKALIGAFYLATCLIVMEGTARAQAPTIESTLPASPGGGGSTLGASPGALKPGIVGRGGDGQILGGRPGASTPRVPTSISTPAQNATQVETPALPIQNNNPTDKPIYGSLAFPKLIEEGPENGLTLDAAIDRAVRENLELRAQYLEIPLAQADILTASLRANPIFYADSQLIPYGKYSNQRPGGQTQYDVNISYPLDITKKRQARTVVAIQAKKVTEAQFQNAVRLRIDEVYSAYVDMLAARGAMKFSQAGVAGLTEAYNAVQELQKRGERNAADVRRVKIQLDNAQIGLVANEEAYRKTKRAMGVLLAMTPEEAEEMEPRGILYSTPVELPSTQELMTTALQARPDINSFRLGVTRAEAEVNLARANRLQDVYLLVQPYTFQDNTPQGLKSSTSYALGVTVPLPVYNRNQGNIQRARHNVTQTQIQLSALERQIMTEVRQAEQELKLSMSTVRQLESTVNPAAERVLTDSERLFRGGEANLLDYLNARSQYNDVARQYLDSLVRYRRAVLNLNTVLGVRLLP